MFKLNNKILEEVDKAGSGNMAPPQLKKQLTTMFAKQIKFANKKLEEFITTLLDGLKISDRS
jgi:hypothetical protein